jgi:ferredoxin-NADP reductase
VERIVDHGERVYTVALRPDRPAPRFRAGQFLHLALDPYNPTRFWPESRVFSIASPPSRRDLLSISYSVKGRFTSRMEADLVEGSDVWIKMPYGDFVIDGRRDVVLFAGGTGISAFTAFLEDLTPEALPVTLAYGGLSSRLGRLSVAAIWPSLVRPLQAAYYVSGPPAMLQTVRQDLRAHGVSAEAIFIDAWE